MVTLFLALASGFALGLLAWGVYDLNAQVLAGERDVAVGTEVHPVLAALRPYAQALGYTCLRLGLAGGRRRGGVRVRDDRPGMLDRLKVLLERAGVVETFGPEALVGAVALGGLVGALIGIPFAAEMGHPLPVLVLAVVGAGFPLLWLNDRVARRRAAMLRALPFCTDLLALHVEVGLDFTAALQNLVERLRPGPLLDEFAVTLNEVRMGKRRDEALRAMADRTGLEEVGTLASAFIQADRLGVGLGRALGVHAAEMRVRRMQRAEKRGHEAPVRLLFPLVAFIFPCVLIVTLGPVALEFVRTYGVR